MHIYWSGLNRINMTGMPPKLWYTCFIRRHSHSFLYPLCWNSSISMINICWSLSNTISGRLRLHSVEITLLHEYNLIGLSVDNAQMFPISWIILFSFAPRGVWDSNCWRNTLHITQCDVSETTFFDRHIKHSSTGAISIISVLCSLQCDGVLPKHPYLAGSPHMMHFGFEYLCIIGSAMGFQSGIQSAPKTLTSRQKFCRQDTKLNTNRRLWHMFTSRKIWGTGFCRKNDHLAEMFRLPE